MPFLICSYCRWSVRADRWQEHEEQHRSERPDLDGTVILCRVVDGELVPLEECE